MFNFITFLSYVLLKFNFLLPEKKKIRKNMRNFCSNYPPNTVSKTKEKITKEEKTFDQVKSTI